MRCMHILAPGACGYGEAPEPTLTDGHVLLRVRRVGYCGSDLNSFRGGNPMVSYPRIPGHEIAATVERLAGDVPRSILPGMDVTVLPYTACGSCSACLSGRSNACRNNRTLGVQQDGALTERISVPWSKLVHLPGLGLPELALVEPLAVGFHAASRGRIRKSDTVLVIGCGMVGLGAIAAAGLVRGANVIALDVDPKKIDLACRAGASHGLLSQAPDTPSRILELTGGHGPSVVIEAVGSPSTFLAAVDHVAFAGRVVYIGYSKAPVAYETRLFVMKELDILGARNATPEDFDAAATLLLTGRYPTQETISRTVPFDGACDALREWSENTGAVTRIHVEL